MPAELLLDERHILGEAAFVEIIVWRGPVSVRGSAHEYRYRLALVVDGECVLRYDNEAGKGDHRHVGDKEHVYRFKSAEQLLADFWSDVEETLK
jgi:hypothetical protein